MKIKDLHSDIERYLAQDCYCHNEIYGTDGFGCRLYYANDDCIKFVETDNFVTCITEYYFGEKQEKPMILVFWKENGKIIDAVSYDATENNIKGIENYVATGKRFTEDHFDKDWDKGLKELLSISDAIMVD